MGRQGELLQSHLLQLRTLCCQHQIGGGGGAADADEDEELLQPLLLLQLLRLLLGKGGTMLGGLA